MSTDSSPNPEDLSTNPSEDEQFKMHTTQYKESVAKRNNKIRVNYNTNIKKYYSELAKIEETIKDLQEKIKIKNEELKKIRDVIEHCNIKIKKAEYAINDAINKKTASDALDAKAIGELRNIVNKLKDPSNNDNNQGNEPFLNEKIIIGFKNVYDVNKKTNVKENITKTVRELINGIVENKQKKNEQIKSKKEKEDELKRIEMELRDVEKNEKTYTTKLTEANKVVKNAAIIAKKQAARVNGMCTYHQYIF